MKNLIEELEKALQDTERLYRHTSEIYNSYLKSHYRGKMEAYMNILDSLKGYNIITAPKSIMLSELIDKIYETKFKSESWVEPIRESDITLRIRVQYGDGYWGDYEFYIRNNKIEINENDYLLPFNEFKWLYTLWIAGTKIIDNLECDDNE